MNKFSDYNVNNKKHKAWTTTEKIYSVNRSNRTVKDIQKQFKNMVQSYKKKRQSYKIFKRKNPATGGGPTHRA